MPDPSIMNEGGTGSSLIARLQKIISQGNPRFKVLSATYAGRDLDNKPIYRIRIRNPKGQVMTRTQTFSGGQLGVPRVPQNTTSGIPSGGNTGAGAGAGGQSPSSESTLQRMRDQALATLARMDGLSANQRDAWKSAILNANSIARMRFVQKQLNDALNVPPPVIAEADQGDGLFDPWAGVNFGGGGGGGGFAGPTYRAPDRRVVEDMVKGIMVSLVGTSDPSTVDRLTNLYMKDHRRNFDSPSSEIDPSQSVIAALRETPLYKQIHALRPDSEDERSWVGDRKAAGARGGLQGNLQDEFAQEQAIIGGDIDDAEIAAGFVQGRETGSFRGTAVQDRMREKAVNLFRQVTI